MVQYCAYYNVTRQTTERFEKSVEKLKWVCGKNKYVKNTFFVIAGLGSCHTLLTNTGKASRPGTQEKKG
jgi:hypothetical protein